MNNLFSSHGAQLSESDIKLIHGIIESISDEPWDRMAEKARNNLSDLIGDDADSLEYAVITISEIADMIRMYLVDMRNTRREEEANGLAYSREDELCYTHQFLVWHSLMKLLRQYAAECGDDYVHLCDKGCAAVRYRKSHHEKE